MDHATMKVTDFAKKLRARSEELKKLKTKRVAEFQKKLAEWKDALRVWVDVNSDSRIDSISATNIKESASRYDDRPGFNTGRFFAGAPRPPSYSAVEECEKQISLIATKLRALSITGQKTIGVDDRDIQKFFTLDGEAQ